MNKRYPNLCKPIKIGNVLVKNRMFSAPTACAVSDDADEYLLHDIITKDNKQGLCILSFPAITLDFDELFDVEDY